MVGMREAVSRRSGGDLARRYSTDMRSARTESLIRRGSVSIFGNACFFQRILAHSCRRCSETSTIQQS